MPDVTINLSRVLDRFQGPWEIVSGRKVAHALMHGGSACGHIHSSARSSAAKTTRVCNQCLMALLSDSCPMVEKFFGGTPSRSARRKRRKLWREFIHAGVEAER